MSCAGYESCAEDSAEPVPRALPTTLTAGGGGLALVHLGLSPRLPIAPRRIVRAPQPTAPRRLPQHQGTDGQGPAERPAAARRSRSEEA